MIDAQSTKPRLYLDVDGVLADLMSEFLWLHNRCTGVVRELDSLLHYDLEKCGINRTMADLIFATPGLAARLPQIAHNTIDLVVGLRIKYDVYAVSAAQQWATDRIHWLERWTGIGVENIVLTRRKDLLLPGTLVDDSMDNINAFCAVSELHDGVVFDQPWNRNEFMSVPGQTRRIKSLADLISVQQMIESI